MYETTLRLKLRVKRTNKERENYYWKENKELLLSTQRKKEQKKDEK
jgi:hypothetical protein